jgi:hypothetical protein
MPAESQNQQEVMGMAHAIQEGKMKPKAGTTSAKIAQTMKPADVKELASTPRKGLPEKKRTPRVKVVRKDIKQIP